jgi:hypothetical protein
MKFVIRFRHNEKNGPSRIMVVQISAKKGESSGEFRLLKMRKYFNYFLISFVTFCNIVEEKY